MPLDLDQQSNPLPNVPTRISPKIPRIMEGDMTPLMNEEIQRVVECLEHSKPTN